MKLDQSNEQQAWGLILLAKKLNIKIGTYIDYYTEETIPLFGIYDFLICNTKKHYSAFQWHPNCFFVQWGTNVDVFKADDLELKDSSRIVFFHSSGMNPKRKGTDLVLRSFKNLSTNSKLIIHTQKNLYNEFSH